ncbi:MAG: restriction endonuclease subunit S [Cytophagaceae bacterium]|nr:restriction endonuclease subunit S [Cytophagaceae bacterium]
MGECSINRDGERIPISQSERERKEKKYDYYGASGVIDQIDGYTHNGDFLLIGEDGANLVTRSTPIAFIARGQFWVNNHAHVLQYLNEVSLKRAEIYLNAIDLKPYITGGFQPKLNQANLNLVVFPFPPLAEQAAIVAKVEGLLGQVRALETGATRQQALAGALMQAVLGEVLGAG